MDNFFEGSILKMSTLTPGEKRIVKYVEGKGRLSKRIAELGFVKGQELMILKKSFLNGTFLVEIGDYILSVRKSVADLVWVS